MTTSTDAPAEWLRLGQAARRLDVCHGTVRNAIIRGALPARRTPGGHYRVRLQDVEALLARMTV